ncbi:MAG: hypothetical protein ABWY82_25635 [Tardiphaga sp.]
MIGEIVCGSCSWFGGPHDEGVSPSEALAWWETWEQVVRDHAEGLFLDEPPPNTTGLARRLDPDEFYIAMRWDYDEISKADLVRTICLVRSPETSLAFWARPSDWGPHEDTGRVCDISPGLMEALGVDTDWELEIVVIPPKRETEVA